MPRPGPTGETVRCAFTLRLVPAVHARQNIPCRALGFAKAADNHSKLRVRGHASVSITHERYGHLFPGSEDQARALLDRYLDAHGG